MGHVHDLEPIIAHGFQRRNPLAHAIHENLATAARNRAKPCGLEIRDNSLEWLIKDFTKMDELTRAEAMDVDPREFAFDVREQIEVPRLGELGMMAALHQNLRS